MRIDFLPGGKLSRFIFFLVIIIAILISFDLSVTSVMSTKTVLLHVILRSI